MVLLRIPARRPDPARGARVVTRNSSRETLAGRMAHAVGVRPPGRHGPPERHRLPRRLRGSSSHAFGHRRRFEVIARANSSAARWWRARPRPAAMGATTLEAG